ncbi:vacuolar segregation subunit 7-domain-containing protein [Immersiella caudata]|uniref:Vacuolar segregation subunit 7-domain-containing protein n=1 Tax=Immersiella caudata TaxID=314043 RepID=A0AA40BZL9_9PEZI|nr:vacuolar segregation subunit 7-domain-containing protein [Immersiella caudata]
MDKPASVANGSREPSRSRSPSNAAQTPFPTLSRESTTSTATITPKTDSWPPKLTTQTSSTSASSSAAPSPFASREPSPTRPLSRTNVSRASSTNPGTRSRKNSLHDVSPSRVGRPSIPTASSAVRTLSSTTTPTLLPVTSDSTLGAAPVKSPTAQEHLRESPRWPVSPRLRSPPPILHKPNFAPPRREQDAPSITVQRATPPHPSGPEAQSDTDTDDAYLPSGVRTPARGAGGSAPALETVQEVSPLGSPRGPESMEEKLDDSFISETSQSDAADISFVKSLVGKASMALNESGSESGSVKTSRRSGPTSAPSLTRQSSSTVKPGLAKGKAGEISLQSMTVETEVTAIPHVALAPGGTQSTTGTLRQKPSTETIRPKKEKRKSSRKQPAVTSGTGELSQFFQPKRRHHQTIRSVASANEMRIVSPTKYHGYYDDAASLRPSSPITRRQSFVIHPMSSLLTRHRPASSKADIFEAKVASAVEEANSSDSEETFVYDSNPPDGRDRPHRFHSRTPSATSMASQVDRNGMRSIHAVLESSGPPIAVKKSMKFVNSYNSNANDSANGEDDGKGTGRSNVGAGSTRGTVRHHHHFGRWGRNGGNGHPSIFAEQSPFGASIAAGNSVSRQSSGPPSPRFSTRGGGANGKRNAHLTAGYDLDETTGADDETTPLIPSGTMRSSRSGRTRRGQYSSRGLESQSYRSPPSVLNRFASCLVLTVMLLLVVSGAIGFMFATSQPLTDIQLVSMLNVVTSQQELMLDLTVKAHNPNVVVVVVDAADIEVFAKSPHASTDSEWWRKHPEKGEPFPEPSKGDDFSIQDDAPEDPPKDPGDVVPTMRLGTITGFDSALTFEGSFFHSGISTSTGEVRLKNPGNGTYGGSERWEEILKDEFQLVLKGVLKYTLPLSQRVRTAAIIGKTTVKPNAPNDPPGLQPNGTKGGVSISF